MLQMKNSLNNNNNDNNNENKNNNNNKTVELAGHFIENETADKNTNK